MQNVKSLLDLIQEEDKIVCKINRINVTVHEYEEMGVIEDYILDKYYNRIRKLQHSRKMVLKSINQLLRSVEEDKYVKHINKRNINSNISK